MDVVVEQLVYGNFPFWGRGYDVLARSPGVRVEQESEVLAACRNLGEAPSGVVLVPCLFSIPLACGTRAIVGVEPLGVDDRGRPGALAFHALLVEARDFRKARSNPFAFERAIGRDWSAGTNLEALTWPINPIEAEPDTTDPRAGRIVRALWNGRRVALESAEPIDELARQVWRLLPEATRRRASVATWSFGNANRFDLVALPRLNGVEFDRSYVDLATLLAEPEPSATPVLRRSRRRLGLLLAGFLAMGFGWRCLAPRSNPSIGDRPISVEPVVSLPTLGIEEKARIISRLRDLADRLGIEAASEPGPLMAGIAKQARYRGPKLTPAERTRLSAETDPDRDRAIRWHERLTTTFADDRPLPDDFLALPIPAQLDRLAWSFHLPPDPRPVVLVDRLTEALSRPGPIRPTPLAARYPALSDYAWFLGRLPRSLSQRTQDQGREGSGLNQGIEL